MKTKRHENTENLKWMMEQLGKPYVSRREARLEIANHFGTGKGLLRRVARKRKLTEKNELTKIPKQLRVVVASKERTEVTRQKSEQSAIDEFYLSWEWKRLRYRFLKEKNRRCECCGRSPTDGIAISRRSLAEAHKSFHWDSCPYKEMVE